MKLHIVYPFKQGPYGGGNQFLKALRDELEKQHSYASSIKQADGLLVNANPGSLPYLLHRLVFIQKPVIIRLDGPISLIRGKDEYIDQLLKQFIDIHADGLIFQSHWSKQKNQQLFDIKTPLETVIHNAPDNALFYPPTTRNSSSKIRLIATSWSDNSRKGFDIYTYLDQHLDFSRYEMTFVGNTPVQFKNIKTISPVSSEQLADILHQHDIYLTASQNDPCSNAVLEALACGLPVVARNSGGHPELVQQGGQLFNDEHDVLGIIDEVANHKYSYITPVYSITTVAQAYINFAQHIVAMPKQSPAVWSKLVGSCILYSRYYRYSFLKK